ncbi:hypothetical protein [Streptomyces sp. NRRL S-378]|nr:hypothetical protein [Streptomyces sp. NRRL S-378]
MAFTLNFIVPDRGGVIETVGFEPAISVHVVSVDSLYVAGPDLL